MVEREGVEGESGSEIVDVKTQTDKLIETSKCIQEDKCRKTKVDRKRDKVTR